MIILSGIMNFFPKKGPMIHMTHAIIDRWTNLCSISSDLNFLGDTVFVQGAAATPTQLVSALAQHGKAANLSDVQVCSMHTEGLAEYTDPSLEKTFRSVSFFMGGNVRKAVSEGRADAVPIFLHEIPKLFHQKIYRPDVALISVSCRISLLLNP